MRSLVKKGNTIHVPAHLLGGEKSEKITLNWSQWLGSHSEDYYVCNFTVKSGDDGSGLIFVQADKVDELKSKKTEGEDLTVVVDESFEYGQNVEKTKRFLVFHNTDNRPYQHRFVENCHTQMAGHAVDYAGELGFGSVAECGENLGKNFLGDYLHKFE